MRRATIAIATILTAAGGGAFADCEDVNLYDVSGGSFVLDSSLINAWSASGTPVDLVVPMFVIEHPRGLVLFDTGIAAAVADGGCADYWGDGLCNFVTPKWTREDVVDRKLARIGHALADVTHVVHSHFHVDHVGNIEMFPEAVHVVQKAEIQHAWWPEKMFRGPFLLKDYDEARDFQYMELAGDFDLFGDGCIEVLSTPGHTPGHQSLAVRLPRTGTVILTGDTMYAPEHLAGTAVPGYTQDVSANLASNERLKWLRDAEGAEIWITHDMAQHKARRHLEPYE